MKRDELVAAAVGIDAGTATAAAELAIREADRAERAVAETPQRLAEQEKATAAERTWRELAGREQSFLHRLSPRRNVWPELLEHDAKVAELDKKLGLAITAVRELEDEHAVAERNDHDTLIRWHADGGDGERPEPSAPRIRHGLEQRRADVAALEQVVGEAAEGRARFIERHRDRLAERADKLADESRARYVELVQEIATARDDLLAYAAAARFARRFPDPSASTETPTPVSLPGQRTMFAFEQLLNALRADAERIAHRPESAEPRDRATWLTPEDEAQATFRENVARLRDEGWAS